MTTASAPVNTVPATTSAAVDLLGSPSIPERAGGSAAEFPVPSRSRSPQLLRRLQVVVALALLVAGALATWVIVDLRSDLATSPERTEQYARLGEVRHALHRAADLAARSAIASEAADGSRATDSGDQLATAAGLLVDAARARPQDAEALNRISQQVSRYAQALAQARGADRGPALTQLTTADAVLDKALGELGAMQSALSQEAANQPLSQNAALVWWPMLAVLAVVAWASWRVAQLSHRVVNPGLAGAAVAVVLVLGIALGAQASSADASQVSRTEQFGHVVKLATAVDELDQAQRVLTTAVLRHSWGASQDDVYTAAFRAASEAGNSQDLPSLKAYDTAKVALAQQMAKGDWNGAAKTLSATDDKALDSVAYEFRQAASDNSTAAISDATVAPANARGVMAVQLVFAILIALAGAALGVFGLARRLREYR